MDDRLLSGAGNPVPIHTLPQLGFDLCHTLLRTFESHRTAQFFSLTAGKSSRQHRHL